MKAYVCACVYVITFSSVVFSFFEFLFATLFFSYICMAELRPSYCGKERKEMNYFF